MKKSVSIIASLTLITGLAAPVVASAGDEPHKPVAIERQTSHVSRDYNRPPLDDIVDAKKAARDALVVQEFAAAKKREREQAERAAARKAAIERKAAEERAEKARQQMRKAHEKRVATPRKQTYSRPSGNIKQYAARLVGAGQFGCLDSLFNRESGWNHYAQNPSSGAYGIPQALPGSKMASAGSDWRTNPYTQVRWGVSYIESRYGTPCNAWAHSQQMGWY